MLFFFHFDGSTEVTEYLTRDPAQCQGDPPGVACRLRSFIFVDQKKLFDSAVLTFCLIAFIRRIKLFLSCKTCLQFCFSAMFEQTIRNFKINFIRHDGRNSFSSGDQIIGHISFDLTKETKITSITTRLKGNVNVHWTAGGGGGKQETRKRYSARLDFFDLKGVILQEDRGMLLLVLFGRSDTWQTNSHCLCPFLIATRGTKLQLGTHVYPVTCQLPLGCV